MPTGAGLGGYWSSNGNGTFYNILGNELNVDLGPITFGAAVTYVPGTQDIRNGSVTLTLTSNDPEGPCEPVSAMVTIQILNVDCGAFMWDGNSTPNKN